MVIGDNRPYVTALITLEPEGLAHWRQMREARSPAGQAGRRHGPARRRPDGRRRGEPTRRTGRVHPPVPRAARGVHRGVRAPDAHAEDAARHHRARLRPGHRRPVRVLSRAGAMSWWRW
ncbi:hypothetical protein NKH77_30300 [Streptomyces sp. M19]